MRRFLISELDARAAELADAWGLGVELTCFCDPARLSDARFIRETAKRTAGRRAALHAPYYEIAPCAVDPLMRAVSMHRLRQAARVCAELGVRRMVAHSGCAPQVYYPEWFVPRSIDFWRELLRQIPQEVELALENVLDTSPDALAAICDGVSDARLGVCLDVGHAAVYSAQSPRAWLNALGERVRHVHLHDNSGARDEHAPLDAGTIDWRAFLDELDARAPEAVATIESVDAEACLRRLSAEGRL